MKIHIPIHQGLKRTAMMFLLVVAGLSSVWAQGAVNDIPREINASDATITEMGHATLTVTTHIVTDAQTGRVDTTRSVTAIALMQWSESI